MDVREGGSPGLVGGQEAPAWKQCQGLDVTKAVPVARVCTGWGGREVEELWPEG